MRLASGTNFLGRQVVTMSIDAVTRELDTFSAQQVDKMRSLVHSALLADLYGDEWFRHAMLPRQAAQSQADQARQ
jgi:hypothetical protein